MVVIPSRLDSPTHVISYPGIRQSSKKLLIKRFLYKHFFVGTTKRLWEEEGAEDDAILIFHFQKNAKKGLDKLKGSKEGR